MSALPVPTRLKLTIDQYRLNDLLVRMCHGRAVISAQHPLELDRFNEPQPDLCLLRWRDTYYTDRHPTTADVLLLVEISDASLRYDRTTELALYARSGVPAYWIVDVQDRSILAFSEPAGDAYLRERRARSGERLALGSADSLLAALAM